MEVTSWLEVARYFRLDYQFNSEEEFQGFWKLISDCGPPNREPLGPTECVVLQQKIRGHHFEDAAKLLEEKLLSAAASAAAAPANASSYDRWNVMQAWDLADQQRWHAQQEQQQMAWAAAAEERNELAEQHEMLRQKAKDEHDHCRASSSSSSVSSSGRSPSTPSDEDDAPNKEADAPGQSAAAAGSAAWAARPFYGKADSAASARASWTQHGSAAWVAPAASARASWTEMFWRSAYHSQPSQPWSSTNNTQHWRTTGHGRSDDGGWTTKKKQRAHSYRNGNLPARPFSEVKMCRQCRKNQPSPYCVIQGELCSVCCEQHRRTTGVRCPQHQHFEITR